ncbi:MAG: MFS transporter [Planctomycetaceae bacterium]|nr:MFS transporter [Planctomycetaceae bacterium]
MKKMVFGRYDVGGCMAFMSYALCSLVIPMCLVPLALSLGFPLDDGGMSLGGALQMGRSIPMVVAMILCGFAAGRWGKRRTMGVSILFMAVGIMAASFAPVYGLLFVALAVAGLGEGVIEGLATPFIQDLHPKEPGRYINVIHSFWSVGVILAVLAAGFLLYNGVSWRILVFCAGLFSLIPSLIYLLPDRNLVENEEQVHWRDIVSKSRDIVRLPRFWLFFAAMFFVGGGEFCLTFWCASFIQLEYGGNAWVAGAGTACFAAGMFVGRIASGFLIHQRNLKKLIVVMALASALISLAFPMLQSIWLLFVLLFLAGIATGPFWPSVQSDGAVRIKGDYTMMMILFSCAGVPGSGFFATLMGVVGDWVGLRASFYLVPLCFLVVFILMTYDMVTKKSEHITDSGRLETAAPSRWSARLKPINPPLPLPPQPFPPLHGREGGFLGPRR